MKTKKYEIVYRMQMDGSPTFIEVTGGLTSNTGRINGAVLQFMEDGCDLWTAVLTMEDMDRLVDVLVDTMADQRAQSASEWAQMNKGGEE